MPPELWPPTLQQLLDDSYGETQKPRTLTTDVAIGPTKKRLQYTKEMPVIDCSIIVTMAGYQTFKQFYNVTLSGGVKTFTYNHPVSQLPLTYRFSEEPQLSAIGPLHFRINMQWEQL